MKDKEYDILLREYEKLNRERADMYILSFDEHIAYLKRAFSRADFSKHSNEKAVEVAILWMHGGDDLMKYYNALKARDTKMLNDVLFETAHIKQIENILNPGVDHGYYGFRITPNLMAANMMDRLELVLPEENGVSTWSYIGAAAANLLMGIMYDNRELKEDALRLANRQLEKKVPNCYRLFVECMMAIMQCDYAGFNEKINLFCKAYMSLKDSDMNGFNRRFCIEAHGMYNLARYAYAGAMRDKIELPTADNFCQDLALWQSGHDCKAGEVYYHYPMELDFYNRIMKCRPVQMHLIKNGRSRCIDTERYLKELISENNLSL